MLIPNFTCIVCLVRVCEFVSVRVASVRVASLRVASLRVGELFVFLIIALFLDVGREHGNDFIQ